MSATPRSTRREFLTGQAAVEAAGAFGVELGDSQDLGTDESYLLRLSRRAMACTFEVFLNAGQYPHGTETAIAALDLVDRLEDQLSVYRDESEICRLNRAAALLAVAVEPRLFDLLSRAVEIHRATGGAFDVTAGRLSDVWGFTRRHGKIPADEDLQAARECVGTEYLELDREAQSIRFARPGLEINLGSIGKGYALDRCAELLESAGVHDFLLHGGSSSVLARGAHGGVPRSEEADAGAWHVGVRHPLHPERRLGQLRLSNRALATSGSGTQFFVHQGRRYGHILDPRSGWPAEGVLSTSVLAPSAAEADALATAFYVMGPRHAADFCQTRPDVSAVLLCPAPRAGSVQIHRLNLDERDQGGLDDPTGEPSDGQTDRPEG